MKRIVSLILAALLLFAFTAVAEQEPAQEAAANQETTAQEGPQTYSWDQYQKVAELMGAEGNFCDYKQFSLKMWIPKELIQAENINEKDVAAGYIDFFGNDEYALEIGVQFTNVGENINTVADLMDVIDREKYDAPTLTRINQYNALLLTENNGENLIVCIGAGGGDFLMVHYFHMNADKWCTDRAALSMASIQQMDA